MSINTTFTYPVLSVSETRICEQYVIQNEPVSSLNLMERAGIACADKIAQIAKERATRNIYIFCGTGNNGGDGLVVARRLHEAFPSDKHGIHVLICHAEQARYSEEMHHNMDRWQTIVDGNKNRTVEHYTAGTPIPTNADDIIVDAIFGIGLSRPATGIHADAIRSINASDAYVIAIDTPSGLQIDTYTPHDNAIVMADMTLAIQYNKLAFLLPSVYPFCGQVFVIDIQMIAPPEMSWSMECLTMETIRAMMRPTNPYAHKGSFGHGLLIAGSANMPGAALLAATAAMRGGLGKVTVHTADRAADYLPVALPEAILSRDRDTQVVSEIPWGKLQSSINAIAVGPGLGTDRKTVNAIKDVLNSVQAPVILDADALNMLADNKTWLAYLPQNSILTPHFKEFERLAGPVQNDFERIEKARAFAQRFGIILILKGHHTVITMPDGFQFFNTTGNAGMGTAGSGDTLTGLFLALLAQGYNPAETALLGTFIHGLAGDIFVEEHAPQTLIASDLPRYFSKAFQRINNHK